MKIHGIPKKIKWRRSDDQKYTYAEFGPGNRWCAYFAYRDNFFRIEGRLFDFYYGEKKMFSSLDEAENYIQECYNEYWKELSEIEYTGKSSLGSLIEKLFTGALTHKEKPKVKKYHPSSIRVKRSKFYLRKIGSNRW